MTNIQRIEFDFRPSPDDGYTETERMNALIANRGPGSTCISIFGQSGKVFSITRNWKTDFETKKKERSATVFIF
jgi:hypothetical protein